MAWSPLGPSGGVPFLGGPVSGLGIFIKEKINVHCKDLAHRGGRGQSCASRCMGRVRGGSIRPFSKCSSHCLTQYGCKG